MHEEQFMLPPPSESVNIDKTNPQPSLSLSLKPDYESMETTSETFEETKETTASSSETPLLIPSFFPAYLPVPYQLWPSNVGCPLEEDKRAEKSHHQVLKPTPIFRKEPVNVDELVGMSQLSLGETETGHMEPPQLSLNLLGEPSRQSAFHASTPASGSGARATAAAVVSSKQFE